MNCKTPLLLLIIIIISVVGKAQTTNELPNIILIMADDMGYECLGSYGSTYATPVLDSLASRGIRFAHAVSQPLCTPSRVKIMTGLYNYRNYDDFGYLSSDQYTFGNLMKEAGYATCIAGKWQLNGLAYKDRIPSWSDSTRPQQFGFDEYCLWQLTHARSEGERYSDPLIEQNGKVLETNEDHYGPDIFAEYILDFLERKQDEPFFVYYPMVLVHDPFVPTPDSQEWSDPARRYEDDTAHFRDMVAYTDKIVGRIATKLKALGIDDHTVLMFTGDNGTHPSIYTPTDEGIIQGGKGNTTDAGTHVPLIAYWPEKIHQGFVYEGLIEFSDFFPTLADMVGKKVQSDGESFYSLLTGRDHSPRETAFVHYDPQWGDRVNQYRNQFARTVEYKLYQDGKFYYIAQDRLERNPLHSDSLSEQQAAVRSTLEREMSKHPAWDADSATGQ